MYDTNRPRPSSYYGPDKGLQATSGRSHPC